MPKKWRPASKRGISYQKVVLHDVVPEGEYVAAPAGDSPFSPRTPLAPVTLLEKPIPAWFWPGVPEEPSIPFDYTVIGRTPDLLVVNKPCFLPSTSNGRIVAETVQTRARIRENNPHIVPLHRLDRLTTGILLCSTNPETRAAYQQLFQRKAITKRYIAHVEGPIPFGPQWTEIELGMRKMGSRVVVDPTGPPTRTMARRLGEGVVELQPATGHTHQLRVLLAWLGCPIIGDDTYPVDRRRRIYDFSKKLELYATSLEFVDPVSNVTRRFARG